MPGLFSLISAYREWKNPAWAEPPLKSPKKNTRAHQTEPLLQDERARLSEYLGAYITAGVIQPTEVYEAQLADDAEHDPSYPFDIYSFLKLLANHSLKHDGFANAALYSLQVEFYDYQAAEVVKDLARLSGRQRCPRN